MKKLTLLFTIAASLAWSQTTINGGRTITGAWDASGAATTKPVKSGITAPATCAIGELFYDTDAVAGSNLFGCTALNTWTLLGGSYTLPTASASVLGGIKVGTNLAIDGGGVLSASSGGPICDPFDVTKFCLSEDFLTGYTTPGNVGKNGLATTAIASGTLNYYNAISAATSANPGIFRILSTAVANSGGTIAIANTNTGSNYTMDTLLSREWEVRWIAKLENTANARVRMGLSSGPGAAPATGEITMGFRFDTDAAFADNTKNTSGSWVAQFCGYNSGACGDIDGVYYVVNVLPNTANHLFSINKTGTTFTWKIDGTAVATMCAAACSMTTPTVATPASIAGPPPRATFAISNTTQAGLQIDYTSFMISGLTRY